MLKDVILAAAAVVVASTLRGGRLTRALSTQARSTAGTAVPIERCGPAIRATFAEHIPEDRARFESEMRGALDLAADDLDLTGAETVLARWHALATMTMGANPLTADEHVQLELLRLVQGLE